MAKILITGGAGFLGTHLCRRLLNDGHNVTVFDNLQTGNLANLEDIKDNPELTFIKGDVRTPFDFKDRFNQIYNLACPASPPQYQADPVGTMMTSILGAQNVLELAKESGARVFQASTSEIYGDPLVHPQNESYFGNVNLIGPRACYDEGKRAAETLFSDYHRRYGVDIRIVRIFNTYGPYMDPNDGRVVSNFILQALRGEALTIYGDGMQTRSFCYASDLIEGFIRLMAYEGEDCHLPVNIGNPGEYTIRELAESVCELVGVSLNTQDRPLPKDDPKQRKPDIQRAQSILSWSPSVPLHEGLHKTVAYFSALQKSGMIAA